MSDAKSLLESLSLQLPIARSVGALDAFPL
jgi:hypothetical protein